MTFPNASEAMLAVQLGTSLRASSEWWFHQSFVSPIRVEEGSIAAIIPFHEKDEFSKLASQVDAWFRQVAADRPLHVPAFRQIFRVMTQVFSWILLDQIVRRQ
jgi:hypothetical protein